VPRFSRIIIGRTTGKHMNRWGIPDWLEEEVKARDRACVYCGTQMTEQMPQRGPRSAVATWEHIINDANIITRENIARCCAACNSSKGNRELSEWLLSSYCKKRGISRITVAEVVKRALLSGQ
jgi:5-methylcytosine-specific restriction endonuclease McrA